MYSSDEVQAAVEKLVRGSIRRPVDPLGIRRVDTSFSDVQEAGATVLMMNAAGPFYCLALGAQRLRDAVAAEALVLDSLLGAILATGRRVLPITTVDSLFNAKAALEELEGAAAGRSQGFKDITKVPSYQRFASSVQAFLDGPAQTVKANGDIVQTPQQARAVIPTLINQLQEAHAALVSRAALLAGGIDDFKAVNLPSLVAAGAISRARQVIGDHADALDGLGSDERLLQVRDVTLDVLAAKGVVRAFGSFSGPIEYFIIGGTGGPFADVLHGAQPARLVTTTVDSCVLIAGAADLQVTNDGGTPFTLTLDPSQIATITSRLSEAVEPTVGSTQGFLIGDGTNPTPPSGATTPNNDELRIELGGTTYSVPLTVSATFTTYRTAQEICDDINAAAIAGLGAEPVFSPLEYSGPFDIDAGTGSTTFHVPGGASDLVALGVKVGHLVHVLSGPNAGLFAISGVTTTTLTVTGTFSAELGANSEVGPSLRAIRIFCSDPEDQVPAETKLAILADTTKSANACDTLGFFPGIYSQCLKTTMDQLVEQVNGRTSALVASSSYTPVATGTGTSSTTNAFSVTFNVAVTPTPYMTVRIDDGPNRGDYLVAGAGSNPNEVILKSTLPVQRQGILPVSFSASIGHKALVLAGKTTTLVASLSIQGSGASILFTTVPALAYGTTQYFKLPEMPSGLGAGDILELYETQYNSPTASYVIDGVEPSLKVIHLATALSVHLAPSPARWVFDPQPVPFARVRIARTFDFTTFQTRLEAWLAATVNQASYFTELNRKVNPLLVNTTPTASQVGDAKNAVLALYDLLTEARATTDTANPALTLEYALEQYTVAPVPAVDTLLRTYLEKGSDRATDLLLAGEFSTFFGLTLDDASYSGAMQSAMRDVAREELAVRKVQRPEASQGPRQISEAQSPDYDYDQSDIEHGAEVDAPAE